MPPNGNESPISCYSSYRNDNFVYPTESALPPTVYAQSYLKYTAKTSNAKSKG